MGKILVSDEQKRMWTICKMNPGATWTEVIYKRYKGRVNREHLVNTLARFIKKQKQLTMVFGSDNGQVYQCQNQYDGIDKYYFEVSLKQSDNKEEEAVEILNHCQNYEFDIENGPLYKFGLICLSENEYIMIHMFHHLIYDAYSLGVFWKTFSSLYNGETIDICSYLKYTEEKTLNKEKQLKNRRYWIKELKRTSVATRLYLGKPVPYSGTGASNFGYRDTSFSLALSVVKCQQMFALAWFRSASHAASSFRSPSMSSILRERH